MNSAVLARASLGPIEPQVLYPLEDFEARSGMGKTALRQARRTGLKVRYVGNRGFIFGRDFLNWVDETARESK